MCGESTNLREGKQFSCDIFFFNTQSWRTLPSFWHYCFPMHTNLFNILCFSCQGKSRDIVYQRMCLFLWIIIAQHGLFEIQLTVYSVLSRLTDLGIYDITLRGIWLLTIFHIPYIHFQRELRKVTSPKWYLSFFVQYRCAGGLKEVGPTVGLPRHRHFVGFFKVHVQEPAQATLFTIISINRPISVAFYAHMGIQRTYSHLKPLGPHGVSISLNTFNNMQQFNSNHIDLWYTINLILSLYHWMLLFICE